MCTISGFYCAVNLPENHNMLVNLFSEVFFVFSLKKCVYVTCENCFFFFFFLKKFFML
jgi:hypothetical protein